LKLTDYRHRAVVVAVSVVRMVQMPIHKIIDMVAVRDGLVTTAGAMDVIGRVRRARMARRASGRVLGRNRQCVLDDDASILMMQVAVVEIVDVAVVLESDVSAARAVDVVVVGVGVAHDRLLERTRT
jgi:hypothetical protein